MRRHRRKDRAADRLLYRRGNFSGSMDQLICDALLGELNAEIALSPGFRWGTTALAGQPLTMEDVLAQTAVTYPQTYVQNMTGGQIKDVLEDVCARIQAITMENGAQYTARMFADCTYEGDLMAQAGVTYTWGRESSAQYNESLAGVRGETPFHQFQVDILPKGADGKLLPEISAAPAGEPGSADRKVQAYNFRMILSHDPANQVAYPKPAHFDPARYETFARLLDAMQKKFGQLCRAHGRSALRHPGPESKGRHQ